MIMRAVAKRTGDDPRRPVVGGVRHRLRPDQRTPQVGDVVFFRCGMTYKVGSQPKSPHLYDCHACEEAWEEEPLG